MKRLLFLVGMSMCTHLLMAQIAVNVTNPTNTTPNMQASYVSVAAALTDLNLVSAMSGPITLTLQAGSETAPVKGFILGSATLNTVLSATNTITINTSGAVTINAGVGTSNGPSSTPDGMFIINGADYVTIDGITFTDGNITNATVAMEFGIGLFKRSSGDGCNFNTIKNCIFNMQSINNVASSGHLADGSVGIAMYNSNYIMAWFSLTPTNGGTLGTNGTNSNNKFYGNTIYGGNYGIVLNGFAATAGVGPAPNAGTFLGDLNNEIGGIIEANGNTLLNFGGAPSAANPSAGIYANNQWSVNISYNTIDNNNGLGTNHPNVLRGIYAQGGTSANVTIINNNLNIKGGGNTHLVCMIDNTSGSTAAANTVNINNNTLAGSYLTATTGAFYGIWSSASAATVNINDNTVQNITYSDAELEGSGTIYLIYNTGLATTINTNQNVVNNITRTGTTGGTTIGVGISSGTNQNANGNTVANMSIEGTGAASGLSGIRTTGSSGSVVEASNNLIHSLNCLKTSGTGTLYGLWNYAEAGVPNGTYNNNVIRNLTHNGIGTVYGLHTSHSFGTRTVADNVIHSLTTGGNTIAGIYLELGSKTISANKVYDIQSTSTGAPIVSGIMIKNIGSYANIHNNLIGDLKAPAASSSSASEPTLRGINCIIMTYSPEGPLNISYNSIHLNGSTEGANFSTCGIYATASIRTTEGELFMRNNVVINKSTPTGVGKTVVFQRSSNTFANYNIASNNNLFFAGTPGSNNLIYYDGTNASQTLSQFKTLVSPRESSTLTEDPPFISIAGASADFLHVDETVATQLESGGVFIAGINDDYDGDVRNLTTPDIGADEFAGTLLDLTPPVIAYSPLANTASTAARNIIVNVTDLSGVPTVSPGWPNLYWRIGAGSWTAATPTGVEGSDYTYIFGAGVDVGDVVQYYVVAQDNAATSNVGAFPSAGASGFTTNPPAAATPPTTPSSYTIVAGIGGALTVGTGGDYPTLTGVGGLFADINSKMITSNISVTILTDLTENGTNALNQWTEDAPGNFTLTIQPSEAVNKTISGSYAGGLIRLNGTDRVAFDGRFGGSGNYLTIQNTSTSTNTAVIQLLSLGAGLGATNNLIRNCNIAAGSNTVTSTFGVYVGGSSISTSGTGADNDNLSILENVITKAYYGVYAVGVATTGILNELVINNNTIGSSTATDAISNRGIQVGNATDVQINQNTIFGFRSSSSTIQITGIEFSTNITNSTISGNLISDIQYTATSFRAGQGISVNTGSNANVQIYNNVIHSLKGHGSVTALNNSWGIMILGGSQIGVYNNSINMTETFGNTNTNIHGGIYVATGASNLSLQNNVIANQAEFGVFYNIYSLAANSAFTAINYNDYYVNGTLPANTTRHVGYIGSTARTNLAAWQTATNQDANSISANPLFTNATNLAPQAGSSLLFAGTNIPVVTEDFNGYDRNNPPSIGAYEYEGTFTGPVILLGGTDAASAYGGIWNNGLNQGYGFGAWTLTANQGSGFAGHFLADPAGAGITGMPNPSFGLYANPGGSGASANADRALVAPLPVGGTLSFDWGVNWDSDVAGGNKGFNLYTAGTGGTQIINVNMANSEAITINGNPMFNNYGTNKMTLSFEYQSAGNLRVYGTGRNGIETFDQVIAVAGAPDAIRFYASGMNGSDERQPYFNNFNIVTSTAGVLATSSVEVKGRVSLNTDITPSHLFIGSGHILNVNPTVDVTVSGNLSNSAGNTGLVLASNNTGTGSLLHNTANVPATIQRYITGGQYHFASVPLTAAANPTAALFMNSYLWKYDPTLPDWVKYLNTTDALTVDQGYMIWYTGPNTTYNFAGNMNDGSFTAATPGGAGTFNLVPNPYPSAIDWDAVSGWTKTNVANATYIYNSTQYATYVNGVGTNSGTNIIPGGQAFFVQATGAAALTMNNNVRVHSNQAFFNEPVISDLFRIAVLSVDGKSDETVVRFTESATASFDSEYDAAKLYGHASAPQLYTMAADSQMFSINSLSMTEGGVSVPLSFEFSANGEITLQFSGVGSFNEQQAIFLEDLVTGSLANLRQHGSYSFNHLVTNDPDRFLLHFRDITGVDEQGNGWMIFANDRKVYVNIPELNGQRASIEMFDVLGSRIFSSEGVLNSPAVVRAMNSGVAVVRVTAQGRVYTTKLFIQ